MQYFIDTHCHMFNLEDVPLYSSLAKRLTPGTTLAAFFATLTRLIDLEDYEAFIRFFENPTEANIKELVAQVAEIAQGKMVLMTPLVMDFFDYNKPSSPVLQQEKNVYRQTAHLRRAINLCEKEADLRNVRILPFMGLDLRRIASKKDLDEFKNSWTNAGGVLASTRRSVPENLNNGDIIGIKLYPPIGFNPDPNTYDVKRARDAIIDFYKWCIDNQIPITTHCQQGSYSNARSHDIQELTHPDNWAAVLDTSGLEQLRLNLAHFGGEDDLVEWLLEPAGEYDDIMPPDSQGKGTWAKRIIELCEEFPNVYSDISAFDFAKPFAGKALQRLLLEKERQSTDLSSNHLFDRLLWGSDVPMVLSSKTYKDSDGHPRYSHLFRRFVGTINKSELQAPGDLIEKMISTNPVNFLFD